MTSEDYRDNWHESLNELERLELDHDRALAQLRCARRIFERLGKLDRYLAIEEDVRVWLKATEWVDGL